MFTNAQDMCQIIYRMFKLWNDVPTFKISLVDS